MSDVHVVRVREELKSAVESKAEKIIIKGDLAEKVNKSLELRTVSKVTIALLTIALVAIPVVPAFVPFAVSIAALTGVEIALITVVVALGITLVLAICKDYEKVHFKVKHGDAEAELELVRRSATSHG